MSPHTPLDHAALIHAGIDPHTTQERADHPVPCQQCRRPTWNLRAYCDAHYRTPAMAVIA